MNVFSTCVFVLVMSATMAQAGSPTDRNPNAGPVDVWIVSATYGSGTRYSDVTQRVTDLLRQPGATLYARPKWLSADPTPGWNKALVIVYEVGGRRHVFTTGEGGKVNVPLLLEAGGATVSPMSRVKNEEVHGSPADLLIISATYGSGTRYSDVTERVYDLLRQQDPALFARPKWLSTDPTPGWNKALVIVYETGSRRHIFTTGEGGKVSASMLWNASGANTSPLPLADGVEVHASTEPALNEITIDHRYASENGPTPVVTALQQQIKAKETEIASLRNALSGRLTPVEVCDLRPGSTMLKVINGVATLHLTFEQSYNLTNWSYTAETSVELPADAPVKFFRYRGEPGTM